jgi:hypothetical protein
LISKIEPRGYKLLKSITNNDIEAVIKKSPNNEKPRTPSRFTPEFYQTLKKELTPTLLKTLPFSMKMEGT